jgi:hypothetical protein
MANSPKFKEWQRIECAKRLGLLQDVEKIVDDLMSEKNIKVEYYNE